MAAQIPTLDEIREAVRQVVREEMTRAAPGVMTVEQAAAHAGRAAKTVRGWIAEGLPVQRRGRSVRIRREDLAAWLSRGEPTHDVVVAAFRRSG